MSLTLASATLSTFFALLVVGLHPFIMDPVEVKVHAVDSSFDQLYIEVPETSGFRFNNRDATPAGYNITEIVNILKDEYDICVDTENLTTTQINMIRDTEPYHVPINIKAVEHVPEYSHPWFPSWIIPETHYLRMHTYYPVSPDSYTGYTVGYTGFNLTLNTVECA